MKKSTKNIIKTAGDYGIEKKDIVFDTLAMAVSADPFAAKVTIEALSRIRRNLGCHTSLGVSNVSFGLPERGALNASFFLLALENGLSASILNPNSREMIRAYKTYCALCGLDEGFADYISFCSGNKTDKAETLLEKEENVLSQLKSAIMKGLKENAGELCKKLLAEKDGLEIVQTAIIPALDEVGKGFESKKIYLPQLLMSAEAAKSAFERIKSAALRNEGTDEKNALPVVLATVKGDVHDIGKNIVHLLLENYGYNVIDLGKDVDAQTVADAVIRSGAKLAGLSALMTTTVPAMEETIKILRERAPWCKVAVGGAVLTEEYAENIGADKYSKDAMETVRYAQTILKTNT